MSRKTKRYKHHEFEGVTTTDDLRRPQLWTEKQLDDFVYSAGIELAEWQREQLIRFGDRRTLGIPKADIHPDHPGRSAGRTAIHSVAHGLAVHRGLVIRDEVGSYQIEVVR